MNDLLFKYKFFKKIKDKINVVYSKKYLIIFNYKYLSAITLAFTIIPWVFDFIIDKY